MNIPAIRLQQQKIAVQEPATPRELVQHMGAVQAQDFPMSRLAIGLRLPGSTDLDIEKALNAGELVRTHVLRPTWHIVAGQDVRWMLALSAKNIKASAAGRDRDLGIDAALYARANDLIVKALDENGGHLTRAEIMVFLGKNGVPTDPSRAVHFMMNAETDALVCNGIPREKEQTYALLDLKVPEKGPVFSREEALVELARRYFESHAPATLPDFHWWSGLSMPDARAGLAAAQPDFEQFEKGGKTYFFPKNLPPAGAENGVFLLPAFDEFCVSYKNREDVFAAQFHGQAITSNGIFKPIVVAGGQVVGIWKRTLKKNLLLVEPSFFDEKTVLPVAVLENSAARMGEFYGLKIEVKLS